MSNARQAIREAFCALALTEVPDLESALPYEPGDEALPALPCVTLLADLYAQEDRETGPATDNTHGWEVRVYVALTDGPHGRSAYQHAQEQIDELVPALYEVVRKHPDLDGSCEWASVADPGTPVGFLHDGRREYAVKMFHLRAVAHETVG